MTDLIAELAEVVARIREDDTEVRRTGGDPERERYTQRQCVNFLRTNHATLTRILTDYPELRAAHHDLVIRLGEVTTELEAAKNDVSRWQGVAELSHGEMAERMEAARKDAEMWRSLIASVGAEQIVAASKKFGDAEGVLRDTARHRWLRARMDVRDVHRLSHIADDGDFATSQEVDDAIDAAMKESGK
jgi:hypothetical protein